MSLLTKVNRSRLGIQQVLYFLSITPPFLTRSGQRSAAELIGADIPPGLLADVFFSTAVPDTANSVQPKATAVRPTPLALPAHLVGLPAASKQHSPPPVILIGLLSDLGYNNDNYSTRSADYQEQPAPNLFLNLPFSAASLCMTCLPLATHEAPRPLDIRSRRRYNRRQRGRRSLNVLSTLGDN